MSQPGSFLPWTGGVATSQRGACLGLGWSCFSQSDAGCPKSADTMVGSQFGGIQDAARVFHIQQVTGTDSKKRDRSSGSSFSAGSSAHSSPCAHENSLHALPGVADAGADLIWSRDPYLGGEIP